MLGAAVEVVLGDVAQGFEVDLAAAEDGDRFDFDEAVGAGNPEIGQAGGLQAFADFVRRDVELRVDDDEPLALAFVGDGGDGGGNFAMLAVAEDVVKGFFDLAGAAPSRRRFLRSG